MHVHCIIRYVRRTYHEQREYNYGTLCRQHLQIHTAVAVVYLFLLFDGCRQQKIALVIVGTKPEVERAAVDVEAAELRRHVARHHLVVLKHTDTATC